MKTSTLILCSVLLLSMIVPVVHSIYNPPMDFEPYTRFYQDLDGDSYGNPLKAIHSTIMPKGYVAIDGDCDDNDPKITSDFLFSFYEDKDQDGIGGLENGIRACAQPKGYVTTCCDCDDNDSLIGKGDLNAYYRDLDGDGYGDLNFYKQACIQPKGYVTKCCDCDDKDLTAGLGDIKRYFPDEDNDGYGNPAEKRWFCFQPKGYVENNLDCDDHDPKIGKGEFKAFYKDFDQDGYGDQGFAIYTCDAPKGYVSANNLWDCNDDDKSIGPGEFKSFWIDKDQDGLGDPSSSIYTCQMPKGFVDNSNDCDDTDAKILGGKFYFFDKDLDGYGGSAYGYACSPGKEYTLIKGDCNDNDPLINPGVKETCNGIDDNCNGVIDEGFSKASIEGIPSYICYDSKPIPLNGIPEGGTFSIDGKIITELDPSKYKINVYTLKYSVNTEGCINTTSVQFKIVKLQDLVIFGLKETYLQSDPPFALTGNYKGIFAIDGAVESTIFNTYKYSIGFHTITYTVTEFGCFQQITKTIQILRSPWCPFWSSSFNPKNSIEFFAQRADEKIELKINFLYGVNREF